MMAVHTHNPTTELGRHNQKGQVKPDYLVDALENAEDAWKAVIKLENDEVMQDLIDHARKHAVTCEVLARVAYERWQQELCQHTVKRMVTAGTLRMSYGEPDDGTEQVEMCLACYKVFG